MSLSSQSGLRPKLIVISGPSGAGKTSICRKLAEDPQIDLSVSATTRPKREGEIDGVDYYFLSREEFDSKIQAGEFLEWAEYNRNFYGTLRSEVQRKLETGHWVVLEIEVQGTRRLREAEVGAIYIFIMPPSLGELEKRLRFRKTESEDVIRRRLEIAKNEMHMSHLYDHVIINQDLDQAVVEVRQKIGIDSGAAR
jgi:guanylate kinase